MAKVESNKDRFLVELLQNGSIEKAASIVGISTRTASRYLEDKAFNDLYKEKRKQLLDEILGQLTTAGVKAVRSLESVLDDEEAPPTAKVSASRAILDNMFKGFNLVEYEERLSSLENMIDNEYKGNANLNKMKDTLREN